MAYFANVILPIPLEKLYTYLLSDKEASELQPGMRVAVPFGKARIYTALIYEIHQTPPGVYEPKEIYQILDQQPTVNNYQLRHWKWIADYYMCSLGEVFRSAVPAALLLESETTILRNSSYQNGDEDLNDEEFLIMEALQHQSSLKVTDVSAILEKKKVLPVLNNLIAKRAIRLKEELVDQYKPKLLTYIRAGNASRSGGGLKVIIESLQRAPMQQQALLGFFQLQAQTKKPVKLQDLEQYAKVSRPVLRSLVEKEILEEYLIRTDRLDFSGDADAVAIKQLNQVQSNALEQIREAFKIEKTTLLHGVTSSGKTEVYAELLKEYLGQGRQALYLVPEIALTTQLIGRLQAYFGEFISVYHSRYNLQERVEVWNNVAAKKSKAQLIIGARSALLLPYADLGLIIIDEEHEASYKQFDPAPRYHARDAAIVLAGHHRAAVLLGSATPSLESYYNVRTGKYGYARIDQRFGEVKMPEISLIDIREQSRKKRMKGHFSFELTEAINHALQLGEQVILFQNRRGFAPIVECTTCGHSPQCPNCDVSLTFHQYLEQLRCHYCGFHEVLEQACRACGSFTLDTKGFGTEQVEAELKTLFPSVKTGRMDLDSTRGKFAYEKIITSFEQQDVDVLVGTQMLTKGLDFRNVGLVGIMNADSLFNFPDFRAHERSFQLLTQVAGRAGRTKKQGRVIIQTYNPYHQILQQVIIADYESMFRDQLYEREQYGYPPSKRLIRITFKHKEYNRLNEASDWFAKGLRNVFDSGILGPEFPVVARIRNQYIKHILVKIPKEGSLVKTKNSIKRIEKSFNAISQYRAVRVIYNVDHL